MKLSIQYWSATEQKFSRVLLFPLENKGDVGRNIHTSTLYKFEQVKTRPLDIVFNKPL